jgi:hypothetical protein
MWGMLLCLCAHTPVSCVQQVSYVIGEHPLALGLLRVYLALCFVGQVLHSGKRYQVIWPIWRLESQTVPPECQCRLVYKVQT